MARTRHEAWEDSDGDGVGNNADPNDDNDSLPDVFETQWGFDPLDAMDALLDGDGDSYDNTTEYHAVTDPSDPADNPGIWTIPRYKVVAGDGVASDRFGISVAIEGDRALVGIPPLAGFFGKLFVFMAAIDAGLYGLAIIGVLASVVGAFYYIRIVKLIYFDEPVEAFDRPVAREVGLILAGTTLVILCLWALPGTIIDGATAAAASLVGA